MATQLQVESVLMALAADYTTAENRWRFHKLVDTVSDVSSRLRLIYECFAIAWSDHTTNRYPQSSAEPSASSSIDLTDASYEDFSISSWYAGVMSTGELLNLCKWIIIHASPYRLDADLHHLLLSNLSDDDGRLKLQRWIFNEYLDGISGLSPTT